MGSSPGNSSITLPIACKHGTANDYWHYRYRFDAPSKYKPKKIGSETINHTVMNTFIPALFAYGLYHKQELHKTKALNWLEQIKAEENVITKRLQQVGVGNRPADDSQALIGLKNEYWAPKRRLECATGHAVLKKAWLPDGPALFETAAGSLGRRKCAGARGQHQNDKGNEG